MFEEQISLIEACIINKSVFNFEHKGVKFYNSPHFLFKFYEDKYNFFIDVINIKVFKIEKSLNKKHDSEKNKLTKRYTISKINEILDCINNA